MRQLSSCLFALLLLSACSKTDTNEPEHIPKKFAAFAFQKICNTFLLEEIQYVDSTVRFVNLSETGNDITYRWLFGDGDASTAISPQHAYTKPGKYKVQLTTLYKGQTSDTITKTIRIITGQQEFKTGMRYTQVVDAEEADNKSSLVLVSHYNTSTDPPSYSLLKVDSSLKRAWLKSFTGQNIRASSIKKINNNEYIIAGNVTTGDINQFCLSKINGNGDVLWVKYLSNLAGTNTYATATADGNLLTVGNTAGTNARCAVVKCDASGNELWRKVFDGTQSLPAVSNPANIIELNNNYVFAALKPYAFNQETVLIKLDNNGNLLQQTTVSLLSGSIAFQTGVAYTDNRFMVYATNNQYAYFFTNSFSFLHYKKVAETSINSGVARNSKFFIAEGRHQYSHAMQLQGDGNVDWSTTIVNRIVIGCASSLSGATRYCRRVICLSSGEVIAFSDGENNIQGFNSSSVYIEKFAADGEIM